MVKRATEKEDKRSYLIKFGLYFFISLKNGKADTSVLKTLLFIIIVITKKKIIFNILKILNSFFYIKKKRNTF
ncbi:MAG: hypothetical protein AMS24_00630 [Chlamydiae bacterium SM23_39]|nr:MAG: hypothetical protein AMS24_00630 [Chlamydiae bacterium SM23_39]